MHPNAIPAPSQEVPKGVYFDLEREIWLLRSTIAYHDEFGYYPFDSIEAREDFCEKWVKMTMGEHCTESFNLRKKYEERLKKKYQDLTPREQEALETGNKIWVSRDAPMLAPDGKEEEPQERKDNMLSSKAHKSGKDKDYDSGEEESEGEDADDEEEEEEQQEKEGFEELLDRIPLLRKSFKYGANINDDMKIPVISADVVKDGLAALRSEKLEKWNNKWKKMMVKELELFLKMVNMIRRQTLFLLAQMKTE
ncbi:uncharacterized protein LOC133288136 [Gastrolobium bilobum]|uniref:uncharacterized protein LOC133288136 n=1 Tax=Gastrolobium bilobum TaxID=150636 RepID=UPI002AB0540C|nr:uncharacterized protein LOC133288136 [Gastrolobium bilobum]